MKEIMVQEYWGNFLGSTRKAIEHDDGRLEYIEPEYEDDNEELIEQEDDEDDESLLL